jgi:hypothetical protein
MSSESIIILPLNAQKNMRKTFLVYILLVIFSPSLYSQQSGDLGILGGVTYYVGDLNAGMPFRAPKVALGILYRQNFTSRISLRVHGIQGSVAGSNAQP